MYHDCCLVQYGSFLAQRRAKLSKSYYIVHKELILKHMRRPLGFVPFLNFSLNMLEMIFFFQWVEACCELFDSLVIKSQPGLMMRCRGGGWWLWQICRGRGKIQTKEHLYSHFHTYGKKGKRKPVTIIVHRALTWLWLPVTKSYQYIVSAIYEFLKT